MKELLLQVFKFTYGVFTDVVTGDFENTSKEI